MAFTYDPSIPAGQVRLLVGDNKEDNHQFTDEDIDAFLSIELNDVRSAAALAYESWATFLSSRVADLQLGDYRQSDYHRIREMRTLAHQLRQAVDNHPAWSISQKAWSGMYGFEGREILLNKILRNEI